MALNNSPGSGKALEQQIEVLLERVLPHSFLPGVPIFRADAAMSPDSMANELDFIVHLKSDRIHTLLIIECKACRMTGKGDGRGNFAYPTPNSPWIAHYPRSQTEKSIKDQLRAQRQALLTNLEPLDGEVRIHAVVVASQVEHLDPKPGFIRTQELPSFELSLVRAERFEEYLQSLTSGTVPLRVQQSEILRRIRQGQPVPALGHPEIYNAIEYTRRCRAFIDSEIFRHLTFKPERWAINGSAGMGKSVLLIYATMVFITDRFIDCLRDGSRFLQSFTDDAAKIGLTPLDKRRVWVIAHSEKQRDMLKRMFDRFNDLYGEVDSYNEFRRVKPEFHVFSEVADLDCNILIVDEAHDLGPVGEKRVREWHEKSSGNYLVIACDRHQKLRLSQDETRMIQGINFSRCTKKLSRNYRNPFPAYAGSLGLLFRWFATTGPKTLPKPGQLRDEFGFGDAVQESPGRWLLRSRNDAHPANNWSHVLSTFPSAEAAYQQLSEFPLRKEHVLWIRFTPEESEFNYESLQHWSYHSVFGADASDLLDKYVKGQEFPVVVIEGVPEMFSWTVASSRHPQDLEQARVRMWQARRQVYLAASRANVFLYFILPSATPEDAAAEFAEMFRQLARQPDPESPSGTYWDVRITETAEIHSFDSYVDAIEAESAIQSPTPTEASVPAVPAEPARSQNSTSAITEPPSPVEPPPYSEPPQQAHSNSATPDPAPEIVPSTDEPLLESTPPPVQIPAPDLASLGAVATLAEVAEALGIPVEKAQRRLVSIGFKEIKPSSAVRVGFVSGLMAEPKPVPSPMVPLPMPATKPQAISVRLVRHYPAASTEPQNSYVTPPAKPLNESEPPQPPPISEKQGIRLGALADRMKLPANLVLQILESQGVILDGKNPYIGHVDAHNLAASLVGNRGLPAFKKLATSPIKLKTLANHLGLRPHVVARDLMREQLLLNGDDLVPYESMVRLCHFYKKQLPASPSANS